MLPHLISKIFSGESKTRLRCRLLFHFSSFDEWTFLVALLILFAKQDVWF